MKDKQLSTFSISMFLLVCVFTPGFYTLQKSFVFIGWYAILVALIVIIILCYTAILLSQTQDKMLREETSITGRRDIYPFIIEISLGKTAGTFFMVLFNILLLCLAVGIVTFMTDTFNSIVPPLASTKVISVDNQMRLLCVVVVMLVLPLSIFDSPKSYWFIGNGCGVLSLLTLCISVAVLISYLVNNEKYTGPVRFHTSKLNSVLEVCSYISLLIFAFGFHPYLPTLQLDCDRPRHIPAALLATSTVGALSFVVISSLAYAVFGTDLSSNLYKNMLLSYPSTVSNIPHVLTKVCAALIILQGIVAYSVTVTPLNNIAESLLVQTEFNGSLSLRILVRVAVTLIVAALSILLPHFVPILVITSGLLLSVFDVIMPIICYSVYTNRHIGILRHLFHAIVIILTVVGSTFAVYYTAKNVYWMMVGHSGITSIH